MIEILPGIEVKEVEIGFHSVHVYGPDGHWSNATLVQRERQFGGPLYGPFTATTDETLTVHRGVLTVMYVDSSRDCKDVRVDQTVVLLAGDQFYLVVRTPSASYICDYAGKPDEQRNEDKPATDTPADEPAAGTPDATAPAGDADSRERKTPPTPVATRPAMSIPPSPAPLRTPDAHAGDSLKPRSFLTTPIGTSSGADTKPDDSAAESSRYNPHPTFTK